MHLITLALAPFKQQPFPGIAILEITGDNIQWWVYTKQAGWFVASNGNRLHEKLISCNGMKIDNITRKTK